MHGTRGGQCTQTTLWTQFQSFQLLLHWKIKQRPTQPNLSKLDNWIWVCLGSGEQTLPTSLANFSCNTEAMKLCSDVWSFHRCVGELWLVNHHPSACTFPLKSAATSRRLAKNSSLSPEKKDSRWVFSSPPKILGAVCRNKNTESLKRKMTTQ